MDSSHAGDDDGDQAPPHLSSMAHIVQEMEAFQNAHQGAKLEDLDSIVSRLQAHANWIEFVDTEQAAAKSDEAPAHPSNMAHLQQTMESFGNGHDGGEVQDLDSIVYTLQPDSS
ncbi:unnamed protein product [Calypogeia fissa]